MKFAISLIASAFVSSASAYFLNPGSDECEIRIKVVHHLL